MKIVTDYVGEIEYNEADIIDFKAPMYGFPDCSRFILVGTMTEEFPFVWLQSVDKEDVAFLVTNPFFFKDDYDFEISEKDMGILDIDENSDVEVAVTVSVPGEVKDATVNLKSPIIFNFVDKIAKQIILEEDYPFKYKLFNKIEE